jgi:anti-sigma-K factor RskA
MSRSETDSVTQEGLAFEYVAGTLRGQQREQFEQAMKTNEHLQAQVHFWEEQLFQLSDTADALSPDAKTWSFIEQRLAKNLALEKNTESVTHFKKWIYWLVPNLMTAVLVSCLFLYTPLFKNGAPNADYVAVLTNEKGQPILSALTAASKNVMWVKWENLHLGANKNVQLWAISKRDGQARPISVFTATDSGEVILSKANLHLVKEAASLMLTEEDIGGSAIDEPSSVVLAKGVCVLVTSDQKDT